MTRTLLDLSEWKKAPRELRPDEIIPKGCGALDEVDESGVLFPKALIEQLQLEEKDMDRSFPWTDSTEERDRDGDRIKVDGWDLKEIRRNPVVPWSHIYSMPNVGTMTRVWKEKAPGGYKRLRSVKQFLPKGMYPFADLIHDMVAMRAIRMASVGFMPIDWEKDEDVSDEDQKRYYYPLHYKRAELIESSIVMIGSQRNALQEAKSAGINIEAYGAWSEEVLDRKTFGFLSPKDIEEARRVVTPRTLFFDLSDTKNSNEEEIQVEKLLEAIASLKSAVELLGKQIADGQKESEARLLKAVDEKLSQKAQTPETNTTPENKSGLSEEQVVNAVLAALGTKKE